MSPLPDIQIGNEEHLYNIGVVSRMTGITMATLRAWERRYDFPEAERTAGGHRLYSEKDVMRLRWVKLRTDEGMQTSQAINALRHQEQTGHVILTESILTAAEPAIIEEGKRADAGVYLPKVQERLLDSLTQRHGLGADEILGEALALTSPEDLILKVIGPTLEQIGELWEKGGISVATEHLGTNYLRQRLLMWMLGGPPTLAKRPILLACAPNEWHEGSLLIMGALLRRRRWPVAYLGQALPLPDLATFVGELRPQLAVLVAMTEQSATSLAEWPQWLPETAQSGQPIIGYGGRIFVEQPEWRLKMQGMYLGNTFEEGLKTIERLFP